MKYLIKILITQEFFHQSDEVRSIYRIPRKNVHYNLTMCQAPIILGEDPGNNDPVQRFFYIFDQPFDKFEKPIVVNECKMGLEVYLEVSALVL